MNVNGFMGSGFSSNSAKSFGTDLESERCINQSE